MPDNTNKEIDGWISYPLIHAGDERSQFMYGKWYYPAFGIQSLEKAIAQAKLEGMRDAIQTIQETHTQIFERGIEEGRRRERKDIATQLARLFPVRKEGDFGLMTLEHKGDAKPSARFSSEDESF